MLSLFTAHFQRCLRRLGAGGIKPIRSLSRKTALFPACPAVFRARSICPDKSATGKKEEGRRGQTVGREASHEKHSFVSWLRGLSNSSTLCGVGIICEKFAPGTRDLTNKVLIRLLGSRGRSVESSGWNPSSVDTFVSATDRHPSQTAHSDRTPCKESTLGRFLVKFWSKMTKTDRKPTENGLKTDPLQDPDRRLPLRRGEGLWLK